MKLPTPIKTDNPISWDRSLLLRWSTLCGVCFSLSKFTSYLSLYLSLNCFYDETFRTGASLSPETRCVMSVERPWVQLSIWVSVSQSFTHSLQSPSGCGLPAQGREPICRQFIQEGIFMWNSFRGRPLFPQSMSVSPIGTLGAVWRWLAATRLQSQQSVLGFGVRELGLNPSIIIS